MKMRTLPLVLVCLGFSVSLAACRATTTASVTDGARAEWTRWRSEREANLRAPTSYLALAGLHWLEQGECRVGSAPENDFVLPSHAPASVAVVTLTADRVWLRADGAPCMVAGEAIDEIELRPDETQVQVGELTLWAIQRGERLGLRLRDPRSPILAAYESTPTYDYDPSWAVEARFEPAPTVTALSVPNIIGTSFSWELAGHLVFEHEGETVRLAVTGDPDEELSVIFGDGTNGSDTYGGGRFLRTGPVHDGRVELDFNRAYNPPCAYSPFTTCPLPVPENRLSVKVTAGERSPN